MKKFLLDPFPTKMNTEPSIADVVSSLLSKETTLNQKYVDVFTLKNQANDPVALNGLIEALRLEDKGSVLLKHEIAYALGQTQKKEALPILFSVLRDKEQDAMVRHEAGEAIGAIGAPEGLEVLKDYVNDPDPSISETCIIAIDRINWANTSEGQNFKNESPFYSVDPAPPCDSKKGQLSVLNLKNQLLDESLSLFERYRAMFALRNINTEESVLALSEGMNDKSALFRHEISYIFGQMQHPASVPAMKKSLSQTTEHQMVRHEAAEALGSISTDESVEFLKNFQSDPVRVVRESVQVGLDISEGNDVVWVSQE